TVRDVVDTGNLPTHRVRGLLLVGIVVDGVIARVTHRTVQFEQVTDGSIGEDRDVELGEPFDDGDIARIIEPEGEGEIVVERDVAMGDVTAFGAVIDAGRGRNRPC